MLHTLKLNDDILVILWVLQLILQHVFQMLMHECSYVNAARSKCGCVDVEA